MRAEQTAEPSMDTAARSILCGKCVSVRWAVNTFVGNSHTKTDTEKGREKRDNLRLIYEELQLCVFAFVHV